MADDIVVTSPTERMQRRMTPERVLTEPEIEEIEVGADDGLSTEELLAQAQKVIADKDKVAADANRRADSEATARTRAERELQRANVGRVNDRQAAVASAVEAAESDEESAAAMLKAAKESGDVDAEVKATKALGAASFRLASARAELETIKTLGTDPTSAAGNVREQGGSGRSAASQAWIDSHSRFNTEKGYRDAVLASHAAAIQDGIAPDSPAYFRALDETVAALEGGNGGGRRMENDGGSGKPQNFNGAPPSRGSGGGGSGGKTVQTAFGPVTVFTKSDGTKSVRVPPDRRADFEEGAKICNMPLGEYILDMAENGNSGLITAEGSVYR